MNDDDLACFAVDEGLLERVLQRPSGMTDQERLLLLDRARHALAQAMDVSLEDAGHALHEAAMHGDVTIQASDQFALVSAWRRLLTVMPRVELRGLANPERN